MWTADFEECHDISRPSWVHQHRPEPHRKHQRLGNPHRKLQRRRRLQRRQKRVERQLGIYRRLTGSKVASWRSRNPETVATQRWTWAQAENEREIQGTTSGKRSHEIHFTTQKFGLRHLLQSFNDHIGVESNFVACPDKLTNFIQQLFLECWRHSQRIISATYLRPILRGMSENIKIDNRKDITWIARNFNFIVRVITSAREKV